MTSAMTSDIWLCSIYGQVRNMTSRKVFFENSQTIQCYFVWVKNECLDFEVSWWQVFHIEIVSQNNTAAVL